MATPIEQLVDLKQENIFGGVVRPTVVLNKTYINDTQTGPQKAYYSLRYNPNTGATVLFDQRKGKDGIIFQSVPGGTTEFTTLGKQLLNDGKLLIPGTTTVVTETYLTQRLISDTKKASQSLKKVDKSAAIPSPISKQDPTKLLTGANVPPKVPDPNEPANPADPNNPKPTGNPVIDALGDAASGVWRLYTDAKQSLITAVPGVNNLKLDPDLQLKFGSNDKKTIVSYAQYPIDALYGRNISTGDREAGKNMQDHVSIYQYSYKAPKSDLIFGKDGIGTITGGVKRESPLKDFIGLVKLPMPNDISDSNNISWGEDAMNNLSAAMTSAVVGSPVDVGLDAAALGAALAAAGVPGGMQLGAQLSMLGKASGGDIPGGLNNILSNSNGRALAGSAFASRLLALGGVQVSPESILARGYGIIPNSNMELLFNAPTLRQFQFNWKMSARSPEEALKIRQIIRFFKQGMAAKKINGTAGSSSVFLGTPNVFKLKYKTINDQDIEGVNRLKVCAVTGCSVNYTPGGSWSAYEDGQPVSTIMTLRMQELEPIFDTDYQEVTDSSSLFVGGKDNTGNLDSIRGTRTSSISDGKKDPYDVGY